MNDEALIRAIRNGDERAIGQAIRDFLAENTDLRYDAQVRDRIDNIYAYYQDNLKNLLYFGES